MSHVWIDNDWVPVAVAFADLQQLRAEVARLTRELGEARPIVEAAREYALAKHALTRFRPGRDDLAVLADRHTAAMNRLFLLALPPALVERVKFDDESAVPPRDEETPA